MVGAIRAEIGDVDPTIPMADVRLMEGLLVDVAPVDPFTFGATAVVFLTIATISCLVPATRATRVDPVVALQDD